MIGNINQRLSPISPHQPCPQWCEHQTGTDDAGQPDVKRRERALDRGTGNDDETRPNNDGDGGGDKAHGFGRPTLEEMHGGIIGGGTLIGLMWLALA